MTDRMDGRLTVVPLGGQQCKATSKRSGERCKRRTAPGATVCAMHGGKAPQVQRAARRRVAAAQVEAMAAKLVPERGDVGPIGDPVELLAIVAGEVDAWRDRLAQLVNAAEAEQVPALLGVYASTTARLESILTALAGHDLAERKVRVEARQTELLAAAVLGAMADLGVNTDDRQVRHVIGRHLRRLDVIETTAQ